MGDYCKWMENNPRWLRIVLCISFLNVTWGLYRLFDGILRKEVLRIVLAAAWILWAGFIGWLLDLLCMIFTDHIFWFQGKKEK